MVIIFISIILFGERADLFISKVPTLHIAKTKTTTKIILPLILLISATKETTVNADWNTNATDYVKAYGETLQYRDGYFWFAQYGQAASTDVDSYAILGFKNNLVITCGKI